MVHEVDSQAKAVIGVRLMIVPFPCFWIETSCENWKVSGTGTDFTQRRSVYLFIYFINLLIYCFIAECFFWGGGGGGGGGLSSTQLLITCYGVVHNPFAFLFVLYKKR